MEKEIKKKKKLNWGSQKGENNNNNKYDTCFVCAKRGVNKFKESRLGDYVLCEDHTDEFIKDEEAFYKTYKITDAVIRQRQQGGVQSAKWYIRTTPGLKSALTKLADKNIRDLANYAQVVLENHVAEKEGRKKDIVPL